MPDLVTWARQQADRRLTPLGRRAIHVQSAGALAAEIGWPSSVSCEILVAATLLHNFGYAPELATTGFHPLDGARFDRVRVTRRSQAWSRITRAPRHEARLRGLDEYLTEYPFENSRLHRALTYCDLVTAPYGQRTTVAERVAEIVHRYGDGHVVSRSALLSLPAFLEIEVEIGP